MTEQFGWFQVSGGQVSLLEYPKWGFMVTLSVIFAEKEYFGKIRVKGIYFLEILNLVFVAEIDCIEIYWITVNLKIAIKSPV